MDKSLDERLSFETILHKEMGNDHQMETQEERVEKDQVVGEDSKSVVQSSFRGGPAFFDRFAGNKELKTLKFSSHSPSLKAF